MTKTYEQRLAEIATEMAKAEYEKLMTSVDVWGKCSAEFRRIKTDSYKPLAAIALKHMAEEWENGYTQVTVDEFIEMDRGKTTTIQQHLINNGLIPPQKP